MKLIFQTYLFPFVLVLLGVTMISSAVLPTSIVGDMISMHDLETGDSDSEKEKDVSDEDDKKKDFENMNSCQLSFAENLKSKLSFFDLTTQNVYLDIISPPPEFKYFNLS